MYGVQIASQALPLATVPYLSRVIGVQAWGLLAMTQAFALYGNLIVEYGFVYSAARDIVDAADDKIENIVASVWGAKLLLIGPVVLLAFVAYRFVPLFNRHPGLLALAVFSEIVKASLPAFFFYGTKQIVIASTLEIGGRVAAAIGIFIFIHNANDVWRFFALHAAGAFAALALGTAMMYRRCRFQLPRWRSSVEILHTGASMFLFRGVYNIYSMSNSFILGLFAPVQAVGYYAGAEKIANAATSLLSPVSTALYPRSAGLAKQSFGKAARLARISARGMLAIALAMTIVIAAGAVWIVPVMLGGKFRNSIPVLQILSLRTLMIAWTQVLGFQWLLALGFEKPLQKITLAALAANILLAACFTPRFSYLGMASAAVMSQAVLAAGIWMLASRRKVDPFLARGAAYE